MRGFVCASMLTAVAFLPLGRALAVPPNLPPGPYSSELEPVSSSASTGLVQLRFTLTPTGGARTEGSGELTVMTTGGLQFLGPETWAYHATAEEPYSTQLTVSVPINDTCCLTICTSSPIGCIVGSQWFINNGDSVHTTTLHPTSYHSSKNVPSYAKDLEQLTPEQRQTEYDLLIDFRGHPPHLREKAEKLAGTLEPTDTENVFSARTTLENIRVLKSMSLVRKVFYDPADFEGDVDSGTSSRAIRDTTFDSAGAGTVEP